MSLFQRLFTRPRVLAEARFALGAALVMGAAGLVIGLALPPLRALPDAPAAVRLFLQSGVGFGMGWWGGLFWAVAIAAHARRFRPAPPLAALTAAAWRSALLVAAVTLAARAAGVSVGVSLLLGVAAATVVARASVTRAARRTAS